MRTRTIAASITAVALLLSASACSAKDDHEVVYHVTSNTGTGVSEIRIEYIDSDGQRARDTTTPNGADWSKTVTMPGRMPTAFIIAGAIPAGTEPMGDHYTLTCTLTVDGKQVMEKKGWQECSITTNFDDLP
jgi:hypothetical protein